MATLTPRSPTGLDGIIEPYARVDSVLLSWGQPRTLDVTCRIKMPDGVVSGEVPDARPDIYRQARLVRQTLTRQAEAAIEAIEEAGYRHLKHPEIDVTGQIISRDRDEEPYLRAEASVRLSLEPPST